MHRADLERWIERTERPMLALAALAVGGYLADLSGVWSTLGVEGPWQAVAVGIDVAFAIDLVLKTAALGRAYLWSPWFVVDLVCTIPILSSLSFAPNVLQGLRFVRVFRMLRALRLLRALRSLRVLRLLGQGVDTLEQRTYHRVLAGAVLTYAVLFVALVSFARSRSPAGEVVAVDGRPVPATFDVTVAQDDGTTTTVALPAGSLLQGPDEAELHLVLGSLLGMLLILVVARFQIPALWSRQMRALLNVALPGQVADYLFQNPDAYDRTVRGPATVLFCDIKGFTTTVESLGLDDVKIHLERALDAVVDAHVAQDLIIDKFIGDAVMSFRGGNLVSGDARDHAWRVVRGALDGARALAALDDPWFREVKVGGASATDALIGTFGTSKRLSYTILGDRVNLAARLEGSCNAVGVRNLFCDLTHTLCEGRDDLAWRRVGRLRVQGKEEVTLVWEAFDPSPSLGWLATYHAALARFEAGDPVAALAGFEAADAESGGDPLSRNYAGRCRELVERGVPADFDPVLETRK